MEICVELASSIFFFPVKAFVPDNRIPIALKLVLVIIDVLPDEPILTEHINSLIVYLRIKNSYILRLTRSLNWYHLVIHHVVEFVKLNQMALVNPLTN